MSDEQDHVARITLSPEQMQRLASIGSRLRVSFEPGHNDATAVELDALLNRLENNDVER